jgi:hypothetical protein
MSKFFVVVSSEEKKAHEACALSMACMRTPALRSSGCRSLLRTRSEMVAAGYLGRRSGRGFCAYG